VHSAYRYTGKERDVESGLDYFPARYLSSSMGRWTSPAPSGLYMADPANPQQLNLYAYVGNNPLGFTDSLGPSTDCGGGGDPSVVCMATTAWDWLKNAFAGSGDNQNPSGTSNPGAGSGPEPDFNQSPGASPMRFPNVQAAGINAARQALGLTSQKDANGYKYEWGGRLLKDKNGQYTFTNPVTFHDSTHFWTSHVMVPFGYRKAGSYHTHPGIGARGCRCRCPMVCFAGAAGVYGRRDERSSVEVRSLDGLLKRTLWSSRVRPNQPATLVRVQ
jgi:RHS repeat-associated protein